MEDKLPWSQMLKAWAICDMGEIRGLRRVTFMTGAITYEVVNGLRSGLGGFILDRTVRIMIVTN